MNGDECSREYTLLQVVCSLVSYRNLLGVEGQQFSRGLLLFTIWSKLALPTYPCDLSTTCLLCIIKLSYRGISVQGVVHYFLALCK